ncbi:hypothetical protein HMPREF1986_00547 [Oribacterium sp. oral taxon 078 str. F0263]|nr:hypothetical protein HMPREF1986_00547 [Oribacterium sp. oral taxon 078 str. F0263]
MPLSVLGFPARQGKYPKHPIPESKPCRRVVCTQAIRRGERLYIIMKISSHAKVGGRRGEDVPRLGARPSENAVGK